MTVIRYALDPARLNAFIKEIYTTSVSITIPSSFADNIAALVPCACGMNWGALIDFVQDFINKILLGTLVPDRTLLQSILDLVVRKDIVCANECYTALAGVLLDFTTMLPDIVSALDQEVPEVNLQQLMTNYLPSSTEITSAADSGCLCSSQANFEPLYKLVDTATSGSISATYFDSIKPAIIDSFTNCPAPSGSEASSTPSTTVHKVVTTVAATMDTFDAAAWKKKMAEYLAVPEDDITVSVRPGSVVVTTAIKTKSIVVTSKVSSKLLELTESTTKASSLMGVSVASVAPPSKLSVADAESDTDVAVPGAAPPPPSSKDDAPCFGRSVSVCRLSDAAVAPSDAYAACFGTGVAAAERVLMSEVQAGDFVLSSKNEASRVIVNQHRAVVTASEVLTIVHEHGELSLTGDHVLFVDGNFVAARHAMPGSTLSSGAKVLAVHRGVEGVINPLTVSGKVLAAVRGEPVVASSYPEWIAPYMLDAAVMPLPMSFSNAISLVFPAQTQTFYDAVVERIFPAGAGSHRSYLEAVPNVFVPVAVVALDAVVAFSFAAYAFVSVCTLATAAAMAYATSRKS